MTSDARKSQIPSFPLYTPVTGCGFTVCGISMSVYSSSARVLRLRPLGEPLRPVVVARPARMAVLVWPAVGRRRRREVAVRRGRGRGPLERRRVPRVVAHLLPHEHAEEEVQDE